MVSGSMYATGWFFIVLTLMGVVLKIVGIWPDPRVLVDLNGIVEVNFSPHQDSGATTSFDTSSNDAHY